MRSNTSLEVIFSCVYFTKYKIATIHVLIKCYVRKGDFSRSLMGHLFRTKSRQETFRCITIRSVGNHVLKSFTFPGLSFCTHFSLALIKPAINRNLKIFLYSKAKINFCQK